MTNEKKKSPAIEHLEKIADRHNEHLESFLQLRLKISKTPLVKKGRGAFNNPYLNLPDIIEQIEPLILDHGFVTIFDDKSTDLDVKEGQCKFIMTLIYVPTNTTISVTGISVKLERHTPQGKRSAYTYAMRSLYASVFALPTKDDDATDTMTVEELDNAIESLEKQRDRLKVKNANGKTQVTKSTAKAEDVF